MNGYLNNIIARTVEQPPSIRPRLASIFEPTIGPAILVAADPLRTNQNVQRRSVSQRHDDHGAPTRPAALDVQPSPIHRSSEADAKRREQAPVRGDEPTIARPPKPRVDSSSLVPHQTVGSWTVSSRIEPLREPADPVPFSQVNETERERVQTSAEGNARREEILSPVASAPVTVIDRVVVETPVQSQPEVLIREVERSVRRDSPRAPAAIVRPEVNLSIEPPPLARETPSSVRITIGRIDVRAVMPHPQPAAPARETKRSAALSLDEYLKQRNGA